VCVLSDERTGLSFVYAAGTRQYSYSWVWGPLVSRLYFIVSDLRLRFRRLLRIARPRWRYSTPSPNTGQLLASELFFITTLHGPRRKQSLYILHNNVIYSIFTCVFVAAGICLWCRCLAINVYSDFTILDFGDHVTVYICLYKEYLLDNCIILQLVSPANEASEVVAYEWAWHMLICKSYMLQWISCRKYVTAYQNRNANVQEGIVGDGP
jgi:hypothetical protein